MNIQLEHPFSMDLDAPWEDLLKNVSTLAEFCKRINNLCKIGTENLPAEQADIKMNNFKGNAFEVFVEMLLKTHSFDTRIGVSNYKPLPNTVKDTGVDGYGIGTNNKIATVQIKFRGDPRVELTANKDHLSNFLCASIFKFDVDKNDYHNMIVITNCAGINGITKKEMLYDRVKCLNGDQLVEMIDNNFPFWDAFRESTKIVIPTILLTQQTISTT